MDKIEKDPASGRLPPPQAPGPAAGSAPPSEGEALLQLLLPLLQASGGSGSAPGEEAGLPAPPEADVFAAGAEKSGMLGLSQLDAGDRAGLAFEPAPAGNTRAGGGGRAGLSEGAGFADPNGGAPLAPAAFGAAPDPLAGRPLPQRLGAPPDAAPAGPFRDGPVPQGSGLDGAPGLLGQGQPPQLGRPPVLADQPPAPGQGQPPQLGQPPQVGQPVQFGPPPALGQPPQPGPPPVQVGPPPAPGQGQPGQGQPPQPGPPPVQVGPPPAPGQGQPGQGQPPQPGPPPVQVGPPPAPGQGQPGQGQPPQLGQPPLQVGPPPTPGQGQPGQGQPPQPGPPPVQVGPPPQPSPPPQPGPPPVQVGPPPQPGPLPVQVGLPPQPGPLPVQVGQPPQPGQGQPPPWGQPPAPGQSPAPDPPASGPSGAAPGPASSSTSDPRATRLDPNLLPRAAAVDGAKVPLPIAKAADDAPLLPRAVASAMGDAAALGLVDVGSGGGDAKLPMAALASGGWGPEAAAGFGGQLTQGLAGLAAETLDARRQAFQSPSHSRSDLENLEPAALGMQRRSMPSAMPMPAAMQPVVAQIAADMYRMQTARLDQLMASRAADEDGEPPPVDADEAMMRQRAIKEVDLGGMWRWDLTPSVGALPDDDDDALLVHLPFRAALLTVTLQDPASVLPMFARQGERDGLRLYIPPSQQNAGAPMQTHWEPVPVPLSAKAAPLSWIAAAEQVFVRLYPQGDAREALQALLGRQAETQPVVGDEASAKRLWKQLCRTNSPRQVPTVLRTLDVEGIPLAPGHAYGILGTFVRDSAWMVTLCDPLAAPESNVFAVPFSAIRRSADTVTLAA